MDFVNFTVQDGEYLGKKDCFHKVANLAAKALKYDCLKESKLKSG